jgi:UDP-N-acetyl-2-amino-2-deoxyglucuronate dehydrogenase
VGADAICEKPLVLNPCNLDALERIEQETGRRIWTVLQLRVHPALVALKQRLDAESGRGQKHSVDLAYITPRGPWYHYSWKGRDEQSGGLVTNIGVHFFDLLIWLFGAPQSHAVLSRDAVKVAGELALERADVRWLLSLDRHDLPAPPPAGTQATVRSIVIDGAQVDFSEGFTGLHTQVYARTLAGRGFGVADARPSIELVQRLR